jgi:hypothetical protein
MKSVAAALIISVFAIPAFANITVDCGHGINADQSALRQRQFRIESDDGQFSGKAGGTWLLFDSNNREQTNGNLTSDENQNLILTIVIDKGAGVGVQYLIQNPWGQATVNAVGKKVGGFAGGMTTGTLECIVFED